MESFSADNLFSYSFFVSNLLFYELLFETIDDDLWTWFQICSKPKTTRTRIRLKETTKKTRTSCVGFKTINESSIEDDDLSSPSHSLSSFCPTPFSIISNEACFHAGANGEFLFNMRFIYSGLPWPNTLRLNWLSTPGLFLAYPISKCRSKIALNNEVW